MKGKRISMLLASLMAVTLFTGFISGQENIKASAYDYSDTEESPFKYEFNNDGTVTITSYRGDDEYVTIPNYLDGGIVTDIGEHAFYERKNIKEVYLPTELRTIDEMAFFKCSKLEKIKFPDSLVYIGDHAFCQCENLEYVHFGDNLEEIGEGAFYRCEELEGDIEFPDGFETFGDLAFYGCESITGVEFPKSLKEIGNSAFAHCSDLEYVKFNDRKKAVKIENGAFRNCASLKDVEIEHKTSLLFKNALFNTPVMFKHIIRLIMIGTGALSILLIILVIRHRKKSKLAKSQEQQPTELPTTRKCASCGNEIRIDAKFCTSCGTPQEPYIPSKQPAETDNGSDKKHKGRGFKIAVGSITTVIICGLIAIVVLFIVFKLDSGYVFGGSTSSSHHSHKDSDDDDDNDDYDNDNNDEYSNHGGSVSLDEANENARLAYEILDEYFTERLYTDDVRPQDEFQHGYYEGTYCPDSNSSDIIEQKLSEAISSGYVKLKLDHWDRIYCYFYVQWCDDASGYGTIGQYPEPLSEEDARSARFGEIVSRERME